MNNLVNLVWLIKLINLLVVTKLESNMYKLDRINNLQYLSTSYSHDKLTTNSVTLLSNRLTNTFIHIYIVI